MRRSCNSDQSVVHRIHGSLVPILASRLRVTVKSRPIRVGEVIRRVIGKCVTKVTKPDIGESSGSLQVCSGHKFGSETAVHAMNSLFQHKETDSVASGCVKRLQLTKNRAAALHNIRVLCLALATSGINIYLPITSTTI